MERHAAVRRRASIDVLPASPRSQKGSLRQHPSHVKAPKQLNRRTSLPFASEMHTEKFLLDCPGFPQTGFSAAVPRLGATSHNAGATVSFQPGPTQVTTDAPADRPIQPRARKVTCEALQRRRQSLDSSALMGNFDRESTTTSVTSGRASRSAHTRTVALPHVASARAARRLRSFDDRYGGTATPERDCDTTIVTVDSTAGPYRRRHTRRGSADHVTSSDMNRTAVVGVCIAETSAQSTLGGRRLVNRRAQRRSSIESHTTASRNSRKDDHQTASTNMNQSSFTAKLHQCDQRPLSPKMQYAQVPADFCYEFDDDRPDANKPLVGDSDFSSQWNVDPYVSPLQQDKPKIASRRALKPHHTNPAAVATTLDTRALGHARDSFEGIENSTRTNMTGPSPSDWSRAESGSSPGHRMPGSDSESARNSADSRLNRFRRSNSMQPVSRLERNAIRSQSRGRSTSMANAHAPISVLTSQPCTEHLTGMTELRSSRIRSQSLQPPVTPRHRADSLRVNLKSPKVADGSVEASPHGVSRPRHQDLSFESTPKRVVASAEPRPCTSLPTSSSSKASKRLSKSKRSLSFNTTLAPPSTPTTVASSVVSTGCVAPGTNGKQTATATRLSAQSSVPSLAAWHQKQRRRASGSHILGDCKSVQSSISVLQQHQTRQSQRHRKLPTKETPGCDNSSPVQWTHSELPTHGSSESALKW